MKLVGLSRQIVLSMVAMAFGVTLLVVLTSYAFWYVAITYWPEQFEQPTWIPSTPEWIWLIATTVTALALATIVAINLARRILLPLNSVADGIRRVSHGDLSARAEAGDRSLGEAAVLADDFNALANELQRVTEEQAFWNAAIAHELRTPVTILRGRLQGLADGVFAPDESQFHRLLVQVEGLARLIEDLRVVSLAESGHLDMQVQPVHLSTEINAVVEVFVDALKAAGQHVVLDADEGRVSCDPARIRQALLALLENARRHAVAGTLRIGAHVQSGWCHLTVEDEGPGVAPAFAPHVFEAFRRAGEDRSGRHGGSGLGLAVVAAIARAHGGQALCRPTERGGTLFELRWPADFVPRSIS